jgi:hypothetical protein
MHYATAVEGNMSNLQFIHEFSSVRSAAVDCRSCGRPVAEAALGFGLGAWTPDYARDGSTPNRLQLSAWQRTGLFYMLVMSAPMLSSWSTVAAYHLFKALCETASHYTLQHRQQQHCTAAGSTPVLINGCFSDFHSRQCTMVFVQQCPSSHYSK